MNSNLLIIEATRFSIYISQTIRRTLLFFVLLLLLTVIPISAVAQAKRSLEFQRLHTLDNGSIAYDGGELEVGEIVTLVVEGVAIRQPILVSLVSLEEEVPLSLGMSSNTQPNIAVNGTTGESGVVTKGIRSTGRVFIKIGSQAKKGRYSLTVFVRDEVPIELEPFTQQDTRYDTSGRSRADLDDSEPNRQAPERIDTGEPRERRADERSRTIQDPITHQCYVNEGKFEGKSDREIEEILEKLRADAMESVENELITDIIDHGSKFLGDGIISGLSRALTSRRERGKTEDKALQDKGLPTKESYRYTKRIVDWIDNVAERSFRTNFATAGDLVNGYRKIGTDNEEECEKISDPTMGLPKLPISHPEESALAKCEKCFKKAYESVNKARSSLHSIKCLFNKGKKIRDDARAIFNSAASMSPITMGFALTEKNKMEKQFIDIVYSPAAKGYNLQISNLEQGLREVSRCEEHYTGFSGWFERFGFMYFSNLTSAYRISKD